MALSLPGARGQGRARGRGRGSGTAGGETGRAKPASTGGARQNGMKLVVPGSPGLTYEEVVAEIYLNAMEDNQLTMKQINRSAVVRKLREDWPGAYPGKANHGKAVWTAITRYVAVSNVDRHLLHYQRHLHDERHSC
jgi:hypothetical protein